jgi:tetratricopeptide (TPR) repeat protein
MAKENYPWLSEYEDRSVTELEILHAFLYDFEHGNAVDTSNMRAYLRVARDEHQRDANPAAGEALARLKERLRASPVQVIQYASVQELGDYVLSDLKAMLASLVAVQHEGRDDQQLDPELEVHEFYGAKMAQFYVAGEPYRNSFASHFGYTAGSRKMELGTPLLISGRTGAGKSALAAHLAQWARGQLEGLDDGKPICVLTHHVGCSVQSRSHVHFVRRALIALKATFGIEKEVPGDDQQLVRSFAEWMEIASERGYTLLVLDGVDKLNNATNAHDMSWLPEPPRQKNKWAATIAQVARFQLVVTAATGTVQHNAMLRKQWRSLELRDFDDEAKQELSRLYLQHRGRQLSATQLQAVVSAPQTAFPLFLRAVLEELVVFGQFEQLDARIAQLLSAASVVEVYTYKLQRLREQVDDTTVKDILSYMWVSRSGLAADELVALVGVPWQTFSLIKEAMDGFLIARTGLLDFIEPMLREAVQKVFLAHKAFERDCRRRLARFLQDRYPPNSERYAEAAWQYWQARDDQALLATITHPQAFALFRSQGHKEDFLTYCRQVGHSLAAAAGDGGGGGGGGGALSPPKPSAAALVAPGTEYRVVLERLAGRLGLDQLLLSAEDGESAAAGAAAAGQQQQQGGGGGGGEAPARWADLGTMVDVTKEVAAFATEVACYPMGERLYEAALQMDEESASASSSEHATAVASDCLQLARLYIRLRHKPRDGTPSFVKGRALLDRAHTILSEGSALALSAATAAATAAAAGSGADEADEERSDNLHALGTVYHLRGLLNMFEAFAGKVSWEEAWADATRAVTLRRRLGDLKNAADSLNLCGTVAMRIGLKHGDFKQLDKAEACYKESLELRESLLSRSDPDIGQVLNSIGDFYLEQGNLLEAEQHYERARRVYIEGLGPKHPRGAHPLIGLAKVRAWPGRTAPHRGGRAGARGCAERERERERPEQRQRQPGPPSLPPPPDTVCTLHMLRELRARLGSAPCWTPCINTSGGGGEARVPERLRAAHRPDGAGIVL